MDPHKPVIEEIDLAKLLRRAARTNSQIFEQMVTGTLKDLAEQGMDISISADARAELGRKCLADLSNGGRGIRNQVEAHLINPLARALFDQNASSGQRFVVQAIREDSVVLSQA